MRTISQALFSSYSTNTKQSRENSQDKKTVYGKNETKNIQSEIVRLPKQELYQTYVSDPLVFNAINKYTQIIMAAGYTFVGSDESVKEIKNFYNNVGMIGGEKDFETILTETFKHQMIVGNAWNENVYNKAGTEILDIDIVNPLTMDYARDSNGQVLFDEYGTILGYTQTLPQGQEAEQKFKTPEEVDLSSKIFLPKERITHFKLYTIGDNLDGLGLIEPIYNSGLRKTNIEQGFANAARRLGYPIMTAEIGDSLHEPTQQQIEDVLNEIDQVDNRSSFSFPYYVKLGLLESKKPEMLSHHLEYFENQQVNGIGMPKAFISGAGEATNRSTLVRQEYIMKLSLKDIITRTVKTIQKNQINVIAKQKKLPDTPKLVWGEISLEETESKAKRIVSYAKAGLLQPSDSLEKYIKRVENLPR